MKTEPIDALRLLSETKLNPIHEIPRYKAGVIARIAFVEGQSSPRIKQLEWEEDCLFADIIVSEGFSLQFYEIKIIDNTLYIGDTEQSFRTIDEAKAAAQADFEKRIKECLL